MAKNVNHTKLIFSEDLMELDDDLYPPIIASLETKFRFILWLISHSL